MQKIIRPAILSARPPALESCFDILRTTDPHAPFALFGGAVRDTDYAAFHGIAAHVNDYDLRVWLPTDDHEERKLEFVARLGTLAHTAIREVPSAGTGIIRYRLDYRGAEMDVSIRPPVTYIRDVNIQTASADNLSVGSRVAIERVKESDIGLSSVAIGSDGTAWETPEHEADRANHTLTVYPRLDAERRLREYSERMLERFPNHEVIWPPGGQTS
jgi:hypothetical protein